MVTAVIVWEYCRDDNWTNFERSISDMVEEHFSKGYRDLLMLAEHQNSATKFYVNLFDMTFITVSSRDTRTFFIRRNVYNEVSLPAKGIFWQWLCKTTKSWKDYDLSVATIMEDVSTSEKADYRVDVSLHSPKYNVIVDLKTMTQQDKVTGLFTSIQRIVAQPYISKQVSTTPVRYSPQQTQTNFGAMPQQQQQQQQLFNQPMQAYSHIPPNVVGTPVMSGLVQPSFVSPSIPSHQRMCAPNHNLPADATLGMSHTKRSRKHTHADVSPLGFGYDIGYPNNNPNYYGFSGPPGVDPNQVTQTQCRMPNSQPSTQSFQVLPSYMPNSAQQPTHNTRKQAVPSVSRKRGRDGFSSTFPSAAGEQRNIIKAENFSTTFSSLIDQGFIICTLGYPAEDCTICFNNLHEKSSYGQSNPSTSASDASSVVYFKKCHHHFHLDCLKAMYEAGIKNGSIQCPHCKTIYGIKRGNCPSGEMSFEFWSSFLPGYESCGTIFIKYHVSGGIQGQEHPNPGRPYSTRGFPRCCYLPNNPEGQKVLKLLIKAWKRRLTFTVGCSVTTGESDTVVWNEIHHKTEERNITGHGYPDPNYLKNVTEELASHGVFDSDNE